MANQTEDSLKHLRTILRRYLTEDEMAEIERVACEAAIAQLFTGQLRPAQL